MNTYIKTDKVYFLNKTIYLDTSAAMHYKGFDIFVAQNENMFINAQKRIIVLRAVWLELIRNFNSKDSRKAEAASYAIAIINSHRAIFDIEDEEVFQFEMEHAFADKEILSSLILERTDSSILLITNDKMLSRDALEINKQSSCKGHKISTCYIADNGNLLPGFSTCEESVNEEIEPKVVVKEVVKIVKEPSEKTWESILLPFGTLAAGIALGKYGNQLLKVIKSIA